MINNVNIDFSELFDAIDKLSAVERIIVAIDGGSASGKTTLANILREKYDCNVFHIDDFFLRPEQRTPERFAEIGGNFDRERFANEVLRALTQNEDVTYRPFDCSTQSLKEPITLERKRINIVEGAYSTHSVLGKYYDLSVFLDIEPNYQRERILIRNSQALAKRFFDEWIPLEKRYFEGDKVRERADIVFSISK